MTLAAQFAQRSAVRSAATQASAPLSSAEPGRPLRSTAWSSVLQGSVQT